MRSLEPTRSSVLLVGGAAVIALLICLAVGAVGLGQISAVHADLEAKKAQVQDGRHIARSMAASEAAYQNALQELKYLEQTVSTRAYIPTLLKQLEALGKEVNLKVAAVRPIKQPVQPVRKSEDADKDKKDEEEAKPPYERQQIEVKVEGAYANTLSFLYRLTTFPKILTVDSVEIVPGPAKMGLPDTDNLNVTFQLTAFILEEKGGGPDSELEAIAAQKANPAAKQSAKPAAKQTPKPDAKLPADPMVKPKAAPAAAGAAGKR